MSGKTNRKHKRNIPYATRRKADGRADKNARRRLRKHLLRQPDDNQARARYAGAATPKALETIDQTPSVVRLRAKRRRVTLGRLARQARLLGTERAADAEFMATLKQEKSRVPVDG